MLVFDQIRRSENQLRWLAIGVLIGMAALMGGLWYVQIVSYHEYQDSLKIQAFRTVRVPAPRGRILDQQNRILAENQPRFTVNLYLEDLREQFRHEYTNNVRREFREQIGTRPTKQQVVDMQETSRYRVVSNIVSQVSLKVLGQQLLLNPKVFSRHYSDQLALPLPILNNLTPQQIAIFMEQCFEVPGVELEVQPMRIYPQGPAAVHALGFLQREDESAVEDEMVFRYRLPDYVGKSGIEASYDEELRGKAGVKSILVNNIGYRQKEETWAPIEPGQDLVLTLDLNIQQAAEQALLMSGPDTRGAAVVIDVRNGDVLAMASCPTFDPNMFMGTISTEENARLIDPKLTPYINRALYAAYPPGSIFKVVVALAALEAGILNPAAIFYNEGYYQLGRRKIRDTAPPGNYDFNDAFKHSCNSYFIDYSLKVGPKALVEMGAAFELGKKTKVVSERQERAGYFPEPGDRVKKDGLIWQDGDTANLAIGQGEIVVTPIQMAMMTAAVANGGKLFKPRLLSRINPPAMVGDAQPQIFPEGEIRRLIPANQKHLQIIRQAMLADVEENGGSGVNAFVQGMRICGKTGTAQKTLPGGGMDHITWFVSFAPFEQPKYAVVVVVESGASGGITCAPKAREIYKAIQKKDLVVVRPLPLAGGPRT